MNGLRQMVGQTNKPSEDEEAGILGEERIISERIQSSPLSPTSKTKKERHESFDDELHALSPPVRLQNSVHNKEDKIIGDDDNSDVDDGDDDDDDDNDGDDDESCKFETNCITPGVSRQGSPSFVSRGGGEEGGVSNATTYDGRRLVQAQLVLEDDDDPMFSRVQELEQEKQKLEEDAIQQKLQLKLAKQALENTLSERRRSPWCVYWTLAGVVVLVVSISVGIWIGFFREAPSPPSPSSPPSPASTKITRLVDRLVAEHGLDKQILLADGTPQNRAITWLARENHTIVEAMIVDGRMQSLVERYAVAVFYYATTRELWYEPNLFMGLDSVCNWQYTRQDDFDITGLACNEDGLIVQLRLGK